MNKNKMIIILRFKEQIGLLKLFYLGLNFQLFVI